MAHRIELLVYPGFELLDASGPASVFAGANHALQEDGQARFYEIGMVSPGGGLVTSSSGIALETRALSALSKAKVDTLLVAGADVESLRAAMADGEVRRRVPGIAAAASRIGSVCSGAFVLAALGLLDKRRATTHWSACAALAAAYPTVVVDPDALFVTDGNVWTSAGVTTGIDMALALVGGDLGPAIASRVARRLVLYARRPGYQSQFSPLLQAQVKTDSPFADLIGWLQTNLDRPLSVPDLAARAGLSERTFYRRFLAATGETPARFIEAIRLDAARMLLSRDLSVKAVAARVGLSPTARFSEAFERRFGMSPRLFREVHPAQGQ